MSIVDTQHWNDWIACAPQAVVASSLWRFHWWPQWWHSPCLFNNLLSPWFIAFKWFTCCWHYLHAVQERWDLYGVGGEVSADSFGHSDGSVSQAVKLKVMS